MVSLYQLIGAEQHKEGLGMVRINRKKNIITITSERETARIDCKCEDEARMASVVVRSSFDRKRKKGIPYTFLDVIASFQAFELGVITES